MTLAISPNLGRRLLILTGLIFALWTSWKVSSDEASPKLASERAAPAPRRTGSKAQPAVPPLPLEWPKRVDQRQPVADMFDLPVPPAMGPPVAVQATSTVPPLKLKYIGRLDGGDHADVFLTDAKDQVMLVKVGEDIADGWKLTAMDTKQLVFRHKASGQEQTMQIGTLQ